MPARPASLRVWLGVIALGCLLAMAAEAPRAALAPAAVSATPVLQRVELAPEARATITVTLTSPVAATLLAAETDCRCLALASPLPLPLPAGAPVALQMAVVGVLPGLKTMTLRTTAGAVQASVHIVSAGLGAGRDALGAALTLATGRRASPWFIVHDLRGQLRNCGCSGGSLGGIDHLAALPAEVARLAPGLGARFVLSGDSDGERAGVGAALAERGWTRDDTAVVVAADPAEAVARPQVVAVIASGPVALNHRKLITPLLDGGLVIEVVLVDGDSGIVEHLRLPVDRTLPADPTILARFGERLSATVAATVPSQDCAACHSSAHATWAGSRHAHAWTSLTPADRVDACVACHSTPVAPATIAPGVHCQDCHQGTAAHAAAGGSVRTSGTVDCRTCHDARHHPGFAPAAAWQAVMHGK